MRYLTLAEALAIAEAVTGTNVETLARLRSARPPRLGASRPASRLRGRGLLPRLHRQGRGARRSHRTLAAATGASTKEIMRRLGHSTQDAALRYQHATDERDRELADGIDRIILAKRAEPSAEILRLPEKPADADG